MLKTCLLAGLLLVLSPACRGQHFLFPKGESLLYFRKNGHREAVYGVGDALSFTVKGSPDKFSERIRGFEDSLLVFDTYKLNVKQISALYVDDKTKIWFILRYKYEKLFLLAGGLFFPLNTFNTREFQPKALAVSGALLGAGLLAHLLVSQKLRIKGKRRLLVLAA